MSKRLQNKTENNDSIFTMHQSLVSNFTVLHKDIMVADVIISGTHTEIKKNVPDSCIQPFGGNRQDMIHIYDFLES